MTAGRQTEELVPDERLWELKRLYGEFEVPPISYGTVRDFADSLDNLGGLARANSDMKDLQRCWAVKAVLGNVQPGGRLVEIGAGEPLAADTLARLGYEVTVIDPYDGSGHGPRQFEEFRASYPRLDFVRDRFPPERGLPAPLDGVYSISVLEHIPTDSVAAGGQGGAGGAAARRLRDPRHRPRRRGLGCGRAPGASRCDREELGASDRAPQ